MTENIFQPGGGEGVVQSDRLTVGIDDGLRSPIVCFSFFVARLYVS